MSNITIKLSGEAADRLRKLVEEEHYARPEDAVADALEALESNRDATLDNWLRGVIAARSEALAADPSRALTASEVRAQLSDRR